MTKTDKTELKLLKDLQLISEEISDLANNGKFENIKSLDKKRRDIIKSFTKIPTETTRIEISKILVMNRSLINKIEKKKLLLSKNYKKFVNVIEAYK